MRYEQVIPVGALTADVKTRLLNETLYCGFMNLPNASIAGFDSC